ncbi:MAG TPA: hypothetical protein VMW19_08530 [Myxococcota bacterium]|nr:hypothetical protein [Myxococcota bacterium]
MAFTRLAIGLALLLLELPLHARATAIYQYTGNPFQMAVGRYTTSDSLSGTIELASALAANLTNAAITLEAWSFGDGLKIFDAGNSTVDSPRVSTDATGRIVNWSIDFSGGPAVGVMGTFDNGPIDQIDQATDFVGSNSLASNTSTPGSWALAPEPSTGALCAFGLSLLGVARARLRPPGRSSGCA